MKIINFFLCKFLRALNIVSGFLDNYNLTSDPVEDTRLRKSIRSILSTTQKSCSNALDENKYFSNKTSKVGIKCTPPKKNIKIDL